ncbi:hypothetical protein JL720_8851 [Aureococcus anophagefferens]|nr:hypothetical protein JL720_8851 [Aureococcus anophagefferens]
MGKATVSVAPASPPRPGPRKLMPRPGSRQYRNRRNRKTSIMANENNFQLSYDQQYMRQNEFPAQDNALFPCCGPSARGASGPVRDRRGLPGPARRRLRLLLVGAARGPRLLGDILVNFNTAFLDKDNCEWVLSRRIGAKYVLSPWFFIDVVAIVPFELFGLARNDAAATSVRLLRLLKIVRLLRLLRVLKLLRLLGKYATRLKVSYRARDPEIRGVYRHDEPLGRVPLPHRLEPRRVPGDDESASRRALRGDDRDNPTWLREEGMHGETLWAQYGAAMAWAVSALNGSAAYGREYCVAVVVMILGCIVLTLMIGEIANVAVSSLDPDDDDDPYRGGVVTGLPQSIHITVTYNDGRGVPRRRGRLRARYLPFGRRFNAAKRASELLITDLATRMTATLYLRDDAIVAMGSWLNNMYLLVDGQAVKRDKSRVLHRPRVVRLDGASHDVIGEDITMKLTTERELSRNHEVTARSTSHCLCLSTVDFLDCMAKSNYKMLVSPMKRDAGWLMLREYCVYHKHVVTEHMDIFSAAHAKLFAHRMQIKVQEDATAGGGRLGALRASSASSSPRSPGARAGRDDDDDDDDSAAATVDALRRTVDRAGRAARRVVVDGDAAESPRSVEELKFQLRASINGDFRLQELDPEALATPGKRRRKVGQLGKHVPPIPADWVRLFEGARSPPRRPFDAPDPRAPPER